MNRLTDALSAAFATNQQDITQARPPGCALAAAVAAAAAHHAGISLGLTPDSLSATRLEQEIGVFSDQQVLHFPDRETLPYDPFSPHPDLISQRIRTLVQLPEIKNGILVVPVATLLHYLVPRQYLDKRSLLLAVGDTLNRQSFDTRLHNAGYHHSNQVFEPGQVAIRGGIIDLFPSGSPRPVRIDLMDDEIESIRWFDPDSQRSEETVDRVEILPAREFPFDDNAANQFADALRENFSFEPRQCPIYQDARKGVAASGMEYYLPLFFNELSTLLDYIEAPLQIITTQAWQGAADTFYKQAQARYEQRRYDQERPVLAPEKLFLTPQALAPLLTSAQKRVRFQIVDEADTTQKPIAKPAPQFDLKSANAEQQQAFANTVQQQPTLIVAESSGRREVLLDYLKHAGIRPAILPSPKDLADVTADKPGIVVAPLTAGALFADCLVLTETELLGDRSPQIRRTSRSQRDPDAIIQDLTDLHDGAPVVHEDHGVGRYRGLSTLVVGDEDAETEYLNIEYAGGGRLYVPVANLHLVSRYTGADAEHAPWHKMGSDQWSKVRKRAARQIRDVAAELLELYAKRAASEGHAFTLDDLLYQKFCAEFPFEETPDQQQAIQSVLADMKAKTTMDRVVCGDVGFGKTEVAVRAAFVATQSGSQVAVLVPTTLLAQQHFRNFSDRFADWPVRVEVLSRFRSKKQVDEVLEAARNGEIDILIGTHRLLSKDIGFKDLGLVIVDEEQRFGVRQKEQLKKLRAEVDLLTLTATPIPRTLNMALAGIRDLSIIATPPGNRMAVKTFVTRWDIALIREAIQREMARGGQVYFLHNEVKNIEKIGRELQEIVPEARIRIAHGQMPERELEQIMLDFTHQRFHVLLCTTIIENGIDVPTANTMLINRADKFGLAQLHQLRGRVGRSHHRAFTYLITPPRKSMTADARKRIEAITSLDELGAGFSLATHDMEIRGAGELLGDDQSGQIHEIGFAMYSELLERAIHALKEGDEPELEDLSPNEIDLDLGIPALFPSDYLGDVHMRLMLYKRIASSKNENDLQELKSEIIDRFGSLPDAANHLFTLNRLRQRLKKLGVTRLLIHEEGGKLELKPNAGIDAQALIRLIQRKPNTYRFDGQTCIRISDVLPNDEDRVSLAEQLITTLTPVQ